MMKIAEIRALSREEQEKALQEASETLFKLRVKKAGSQLEKTHQFRQLRAQVARIRTIIKEQEGKQ